MKILLVFFFLLAPLAARLRSSYPPAFEYGGYRRNLNQLVFGDEQPDIKDLQSALKDRLLAFVKKGGILQSKEAMDSIVATIKDHPSETGFNDGDIQKATPLLYNYVSGLVEIYRTVPENLIPAAVKRLNSHLTVELYRTFSRIDFEMFNTINSIESAVIYVLGWEADHEEQSDAPSNPVVLQRFQEALEEELKLELKKFVGEGGDLASSQATKIIVKVLMKYDEEDTGFSRKDLQRLNRFLFDYISGLICLYEPGMTPLDYTTAAVNLNWQAYLQLQRMFSDWSFAMASTVATIGKAVGYVVIFH
ncbi:hypothetical protein QR680_008737 [Steinernema hermaphroditum]|uniref:Uncharacterized protein n=1 Tax=Steinernema hermaphroditum TaxID=289476 RepID=A0AA39IJ90_9BILA|nr:hypothetical protein QR680_008737 [Steinernema hermaphroditum]